MCGRWSHCCEDVVEHFSSGLVVERSDASYDLVDVTTLLTTVVQLDDIRHRSRDPHYVAWQPRRIIPRMDLSIHMVTNVEDTVPSMPVMLMFVLFLLVAYSAGYVRM